MRYVNVCKMSDEKFLSHFGISREVCINMMRYMRHSPLPDRPMLPGTKMSGGDGPRENVDKWLDLTMEDVSGWYTSTMAPLTKGTINVEVSKRRV